MPLRVFSLFAIPAIAVFAILVLAGLAWWPLWLLAIPAAALVTWLFWRRADDAVLSRLGARSITGSEGERLMNTVENLCLTSGIVQPDVMVVDTDEVNLATINGRRNTIVVTSGLLNALDVLETEGVVAHALSKSAASEVQYSTLAASGGGLVSGAQRRWAREWDGGETGVVRFDISGVRLTRYPPGLRSALQKIDGRPTDVPGGASLGNAWLVPPPETRLPLDHRIEVLQEL